MSHIIVWFKPRILYYFVHLLVYTSVFILTGWSIYPHEPYIWHSLYHFFFSIVLLYLFSYYSIRILLYQRLYSAFLISSLGFFVLSWFIAYYIYPQAGEEKINLPYFIFNRFVFFLIPTIIEIVIQNHQLNNQNKRILLTNKIIQLNQQINPHLLFNTLTTIHYQIRIQSTKAEVLAIKLRELMQYSLYQSTNIWTDLDDEIKFLNSYIEVEKLSFDLKDRVKFYPQIINSKNKIPSLFFIVFFENAFKYSDVRENEEGFIEAILNVDDEQIIFQISNSKHIIRPKTLSSNKIGLTNIRERLNILFPSGYTLKISESPISFKLNLKLELVKAAL